MFSNPLLGLQHSGRTWDPKRGTRSGQMGCHLENGVPLGCQFWVPDIQMGYAHREISLGGVPVQQGSSHYGPQSPKGSDVLTDTYSVM